MIKWIIDVFYRNLKYGEVFLLLWRFYAKTQKHNNKLSFIENAKHFIHDFFSFNHQTIFHFEITLRFSSYKKISLTYETEAFYRILFIIVIFVFMLQIVNPNSSYLKIFQQDNIRK